ncbi:hypothetical protein HK102_008175, partial [Quaeritorhiza haematococci]
MPTRTAAAMETLPPPLPKGRTLPINGDAVRTLRLQRGWNIDDLARKAGCTSRTIENIERGGKRVYAITLVEIAKALGVSHADLLSEIIGQDSEPEGRRVSGVCIHFTMNFRHVDASDELVALMNRLAAAIGASSEIEVFALEDGSLVVVVGMSEEDALRLVEAFGDEVSKGEEGRLDALAVEEISFPPSQTKQQVTAVIRKAKSEDFAATRLEDSNLQKQGLERGWYLLKIAQYEEGRTGRGGDPRKADAALKEITAEATTRGMVPNADA